MNTNHINTIRPRIDTILPLSSFQPFLKPSSYTRVQKIINPCCSPAVCHWERWQFNWTNNAGWGFLGVPGVKPGPLVWSSLSPYRMRGEIIDACVVWYWWTKPRGHPLISREKYVLVEMPKLRFTYYWDYWEDLCCVVSGDVKTRI